MKKTTLFAILFTVLIIGFNNLPVALGYLNQKDNLVYLGRRDINSQDVYTYVAFIEQARQGRVLFENLYTSEPQIPSLIRPSYVLIGTVARFTGLSSITAYHVFRIIFSLIFCFVLFSFLKRFFARDKDRVIAYIVVLTSAGIGFFVKGLAPGSTDLWMPESITFLSLAEAPHFIFSQILMLVGFMTYLMALEKKKMLFCVFSAGSFLLLSFEHPFNLFVTGITLGVFSLWYLVKTKEWRSGAVVGTGIILCTTILGIFYQWLGTVQNPILRSWAQESVLNSPTVHNYIYGYGLLLIFAFFGIEKALKEKGRDQILLIVWIAVAAVLLYSPFPFQRRFSEGLHLPLAIFATVGLLSVSQHFSKLSIKIAQEYVTYGVLVVFILILAATPVDRVLNDIAVISQDSPAGYYQHLLSSEIDAITFLRKTTGSRDIILTNWFYGNLVPGLTGRKVYIGHKVQSPFFDKKVEKMNRFLLETNPKKATAFLKEAGVTYIFLGKNDSMLSYGFKPDSKSYLTKVYDRDDVAIYRVRKSSVY